MDNSLLEYSPESNMSYLYLSIREYNYFFDLPMWIDIEEYNQQDIRKNILISTPSSLA
jgi:hypothetical protein